MLRFSRLDISLFFLAAMQLSVWYSTRHIQPDMTIVPPLSSESTIKATSFGDEQFYFRMLALEMQNAGDMFGRFTALKEYDYKKLTAWFYLLDTLDNRSNFVPSIASYYYSQTQRRSDVRYIVDYLEAHVTYDPQAKWWWLGQAVYLANHKLNDKETALRLANKLAQTPGKDIPLWARQMPAFIYAELGEKEEALIIIRNILENEKNIPKEEKNFMNYFINERLNTIITDGKNTKTQ